MTETTAFDAVLTVPFFWQALLLGFAGLTFGLVAMLLRVARLSRNITALGVRLETLESQPRQLARPAQKTAPLTKTNLAQDPSQPSTADALISEFSADSLIERAISMIRAGEAADQIRLKLGIESELISILIQQHKAR
jgi:hypothetical protein